MKSLPVPVSQLLNLGPKSESWLNDVGIHSKHDLEQVGAVQAFLLLKGKGHKPSLNMLYAMAGALMGVRWDKLTGKKKAKLLLEVDALEDFRKQMR